MTADYYDLDTASVARADGVRDATLTDRWNTPLGTPNGGYILATVLRGLHDEMGADDPLVVAITYLAAPTPGPAEIRTASVRQGRRVQTGTATLWQGDRQIATMTASFGPRPDGPSSQHVSAPRLPQPDQCADPLDHGMPTDGLFGRIDYRLASMPGWAAGAPSGDPSVELWQRLHGGRAIDLPALALLCDSFTPPVLELGDGHQKSMTVQLTVFLHRLPRPGWIATRLSTRHVVDGFHDEDCELWDEDGNLVAQSRQLGILL
jgi:acyl-CoA thioesterase